MTQALSDLFDGQKTISSKSARIFIQRDGKNLLFAECTEFKTKIKKIKEKVKTVGRLGTQNKFVGWEGVGSISGYIINSDLLASEINSLKTGVEQRFNIVAKYYGDDIQGTQTLLYKSVSLDEIDPGALKSDDGLITFETDLTYDDVEVVEKFN